jgi:type I restriction enzyme S subunit
LNASKRPLPPLAEQQRIAAYLDASCAAIDAAVTAKRRQLETLDALRRTVIQESVTKGLDPNVQMTDSGIDWLPEIPKHWSNAKLMRHSPHESWRKIFARTISKSH